MPVYEISDLTKRFDGAERPANDGITLSIAAGRIVGLFGPNGAGKTTLVRQMLGLSRPTAGRIVLYGRDIVRDPDCVGEFASYLPQAGLGAGFWQLRAEEAVGYAARLRGLGRGAAEAEAVRWLGRLGLSGVKRRLLGTLSGGERRGVSLAAALAGVRRVLVADEPTNDLDPEARLKTWGLLRELCDRRGLTVLLVTHNVLEAERIVDDVAVMDRGRLLVYEEARALKERLSGLYLELLAEPGPGPGLRKELSRFGAVEERGRRLTLFCPDALAQSLLDFLRARQRIAPLQWRARTPTLEDAYFSLGGRGGAFAAESA